MIEVVTRKVPKFSPASSGGYKLLQLVVEKAIRIFQTSQHLERVNPACGWQISQQNLPTGN
jgi:hypothetical protein